MDMLPPLVSHTHLNAAGETIQSIDDEIIPTHNLPAEELENTEQKQDKADTKQGDAGEECFHSLGLANDFLQVEDEFALTASIEDTPPPRETHGARNQYFPSDGSRWKGDQDLPRGIGL